MAMQMEISMAVVDTTTEIKRSYVRGDGLDPRNHTTLPSAWLRRGAAVITVTVAGKEVAKVTVYGKLSQEKIARALEQAAQKRGFNAVKAEALVPRLEQIENAWVVDEEKSRYAKQQLEGLPHGIAVIGFPQGSEAARPIEGKTPSRVVKVLRPEQVSEALRREIVGTTLDGITTVYWPQGQKAFETWEDRWMLPLGIPLPDGTKRRVTIRRENDGKYRVVVPELPVERWQVPNWGGKSRYVGVVIKTHEFRLGVGAIEVPEGASPVEPTGEHLVRFEEYGHKGKRRWRLVILNEEAEAAQEAAEESEQDKIRRLAHRFSPSSDADSGLGMWRRKDRSLYAVPVDPTWQPTTATQAVRWVLYVESTKSGLLEPHEKGFRSGVAVAGSLRELLKNWG